MVITRDQQKKGSTSNENPLFNQNNDENGDGLNTGPAAEIAANSNEGKTPINNEILRQIGDMFENIKSSLEQNQNRLFREHEEKMEKMERDNNEKLRQLNEKIENRQGSSQTENVHNGGFEKGLTQSNSQGMFGAKNKKQTHKQFGNPQFNANLFGEHSNRINFDDANDHSPELGFGFGFNRNKENTTDNENQNNDGNLESVLAALKEIVIGVREQNLEMVRTNERCQFAQISATLGRISGTEGRTSIENFFENFESITFGWEQERMAQLLSAHLVGQVKTIFNTLPNGQKKSYKKIKEAILWGQNSIDSLRFTAKSKLQAGLFRRPDEDFRQFGLKVYSTIKDAMMATTPEEILEDEAKSYFLQKVKDPSIKNALLLVHRDLNFYEVIDKAEELRSANYGPVKRNFGPTDCTTAQKTFIPANNQPTNKIQNVIDNKIGVQNKNMGNNGSQNKSGNRNMVTGMNATKLNTNAIYGHNSAEHDIFDDLWENGEEKNYEVGQFEMENREDQHDGYEEDRENPALMGIMSQDMKSIYKRDNITSIKPKNGLAYELSDSKVSKNSIPYSGILGTPAGLASFGFKFTDPTNNIDILDKKCNKWSSIQNEFGPTNEFSDVLALNRLFPVPVECTEFLPEREGFTHQSKKYTLSIKSSMNNSHLKSQENNSNHMKKTRAPGKNLAKLVMLPSVEEGIAKLINELFNILATPKSVKFYTLLPPPLLIPAFEKVIDCLLVAKMDNVVAHPEFRGRTLLSLGWTGAALNKYHAVDGKWTKAGLLNSSCFCTGFLRIFIPSVEPKSNINEKICRPRKTPPICQSNHSTWKWNRYRSLLVIWPNPRPPIIQRLSIQSAEVRHRDDRKERGHYGRK